MMELSSSIDCQPGQLQGATHKCRWRNPLCLRSFAKGCTGLWIRTLKALMNHLRSLSLYLATVFTALLPCLANAAEQVNALWNDDSGFGIWIYPDSGSCPEVRKRLTTFTVIGPKFQARSVRVETATPAEMSVCARMDSKTGSFSKCISGQIKIVFDAPNNEYHGTVDLSLADGSAVRTSIRAQYCKPG